LNVASRSVWHVPHCPITDSWNACESLVAMPCAVWQVWQAGARAPLFSIEPCTPASNWRSIPSWHVPHVAGTFIAATGLDGSVGRRTSCAL
jgi:hypothetical protein